MPGIVIMIALIGLAAVNQFAEYMKHRADNPPERRTR